MRAAAINAVAVGEARSRAIGSGFLFKVSMIAAAAFTIRLIPLILRGGSEWAVANNSEGYMQLALGLSRGCGFAAWLGDKCASPEISRTPGYPLFLWMLPSWRAALFAQAVMSSAVCLLVGMFSFRRWGAGAGLLAAILLAVDMPTIVYSNKIMTEVLFTALCSSGFFAELAALKREALDRGFWLLVLLAAVLIACSILVRPIGEVLLLLVAIPPLVVRRENWLRRAVVAVALVSVSLLVIVVWSQRNWQRTGIRTFSTVGAFNLYNFRAAGVVAYASGRGLVDVWSNWEHVKLGDMSSRAIRIMLAHPLATTYMTGRGFLYVSLIPDRGPLAGLLGTEMSQQMKDPGSFRLFDTLERIGEGRGTLASIYVDECDSSILMAILLAFQVLAILFVWGGVLVAIRGLYLGSYSDDVSIIFLLSLAVCLLLLSSGPEATARFRIPSMPFLSVVASLGWIRAVRMSQPRRLYSVRPIYQR